jgi:two-component system, cell cycle response regulator DivK
MERLPQSQPNLTKTGPLPPHSCRLRSVTIFPLTVKVSFCVGNLPKRDALSLLALPMLVFFAMARGSKTILLVEDNSDLRQLLTKIIGRLGYEVVAATTGEEAVERAFAMRPDLIIMDICLPKLNGAEATAKIKGNATTKHIPIVILSALQLRPELKCALEAAAAEILQKPVRVAELQEVISKHLSVGVEVSTQ